MAPKKKSVAILYCPACGAMRSYEESPLLTAHHQMDYSFYEAGTSPDPFEPCEKAHYRYHCPKCNFVEIHPEILMTP